MKIRFRHLTEYQKSIVCNGCGPKGGLVKPPDFLFKASCNHHDFNYWIGYNRDHRKKADREFYAEMLKDAGQNRYYKFWAKSYYIAVRWFGWACFHWGDKERDSDDLIKYINKKECAA